MLVRLLVLGSLLSTLLAHLVQVEAPGPGSSQHLCFPTVPAIQDCIDVAFSSYWERNGGLAVFGFPTSPALPEETESGLRTVQHFERYRLELHPDAPPPYTIQLGRSGADRLAQLGRSTNAEAQAAPPGCIWLATTQHSICEPFLTYWRTHGLDLGDPGISERESLALLGLPLTEARPETNSSGDHVPTQWFERARLEQHASGLLQGRLNSEVEAAHVPAAPAAGFVEIAGDRLAQGGQKITLKGINYYPSQQPWSLMWTHWDGSAVERELGKARHELGINTIRVLVPYRAVEGWTDDRGNVNPAMLLRLREFVQIAGRQQLKVIVTLFDWQFDFAPAGSQEEGYDLLYLRTIVDAFKDDDRVLAWDLHNEPDHYPAWGEGNQAAIVDWLARMKAATRAIDQRHPVTVGVGKVASLWQAAPNGTTIADLSDIISVHSYDASTYVTIAGEVRSRLGTAKPVVLEEFGWASGPECRGPYFDETSQLYLYRKAFEPAARQELAGMVGWWFQDPPATQSYSLDENGHFGLYRRDGTPKPAVAPFRALRVATLPSATISTLPLTVVTPPPLPKHERPLVFDDGLVLREQFKHFWHFFGGEATFGRPLTLAYRDVNGTMVQYFERARFELNESEHVQPIDPGWPEGQTPEVYLDRVHLSPLGEQALVGRTFHRVADSRQAEVRFFSQTGHTLRGDFLAFWEREGEIFFGAPLSEPFDEFIDGRQTRVQYFAHWRFEQVGGGPVRLGKLGVAALKTRACPQP